MEFHSIESTAARNVRTPAATLRQILSDIERLIGKINHSNHTDLSEIPGLFQQAYDLITDLDDEKNSIAAEKVRFETLSGQFDNEKRQYIRQLGGARNYQAISQTEEHPEHAWWWHLDSSIAEEKTISRKNTLRSGAIAVSVFALIVVLYMLFLAPDEATRTMVQYEAKAESNLTNQNLPAALEAIDIAITAMPEETRLRVFRGVVHHLMGNQDLAEADFESTRSKYDFESDFYVEVANIYMTAQMPGLALESANVAVEMNPDSPYAWYQLGTATNGIGKGATAYKAFETAANLAKEEEIVELEAMSRMQMAYILQGSVAYEEVEYEDDEGVEHEVNEETTP